MPSNNHEFENLDKSIIRKKYVLLKRLGEGGFCVVFLAYCIPTKNFVAIKIQESDWLTEIDTEIKLLKKLKKNNTHNIQDIMETFIIDQYYNKTNIKNTCLVTKIGCNDITEHSYSYNHIIKWILDIVKTVKRMNDLSICHTDIKPDNLIINQFSDEILNWTYQYKKKIDSGLGYLEAINEINDDYDYKTNLCEDVILIDLASCMKFSEFKYKEFQVTTRHYRAPEIILNLSYNEKIDIWSIGCTIYELFTKNVLFEPKKMKKYGRDLHHLHMINSNIGHIPKHMLEKSTKKYLFNGNFDLKDIPSNFNIDNKINKIENKSIKYIIEQCLIIDPHHRINIDNLYDLVYKEYLTL